MSENLTQLVDLIVGIATLGGIGGLGIFVRRTAREEVAPLKVRIVELDHDVEDLETRFDQHLEDHHGTS